MNKERLDFARQSIEEHPRHEIHETAIIAKSAKIGKDGFGWARDENKQLVKINHSGWVMIGPNVEIREFCTVDRGVLKGTEINEGTKIDHHCHIAHNVKIGKWNTFAAGCYIEGSCQIGDFNTFGTGVIVQKKIKVGSHTIIGSGAVITKDVPDYAVIVGNPGRLLRMKDED